MFVAIPFQTALRLGRLPFFSIVIVVICLALYYVQSLNDRAINSAAKVYCEKISSSEKYADYMQENTNLCYYLVYGFHSFPNKEIIPELLKNKWEKIDKGKEISEEEVGDIITDIMFHLKRAEEALPLSLDRKLIADPTFFNPIRTITSTFAHADWRHVIGNLIFFVAFAPALELLMGSITMFFAFIVTVALVCDVAYSLFVLLGAAPLPSLGLSGVVSGFIGLSAFMMPWARVKTLVWILFYARVWLIPAWVLALWFIGWDFYSMTQMELLGSSVNFVAHVAGGVGGYLFGSFFLKNRKEEIEEELTDEIEYMRAKNQDTFGRMSSYKGDSRRIDAERRAWQAEKEYSEHIARVYKLVTSSRHSEAINLILKDYNLHAPSVEIYESLFFDVEKWTHKRTLTCLGNLVIRLLLKRQLFARALRVAEICLKVDPGFSFAQNVDKELIRKYAEEQNVHELIYLLGK